MKSKSKAPTHPYRDLGELFFEQSIRVEKIIWLAACSNQPPQAFEDFLEEEDPAVVTGIFGFNPGGDAEEALSALARKKKQGFLVEAATPIPVSFHKGGHISHGFGWCQMKWFYTEAMDDAFAVRLVEWKEKVVAKAKREFNKKAKEAA
jgi:hypothetical protein